MIELNLTWTEPRLVMTKFGERMVATAQPTEAFWNEWRERKDALKEAGISVSKKDGQWQVARWTKTQSDDERAANLRASRAQDAADITIPVPAGRALLPYQGSGIAYALGRDATLIGDEMGLGKTIQAIGVANASGARRILVACPASLKLNWRNEIAAWQTLDLPARVINAGDRLDPTAPGWYIINFDICHRYQDALKSIEWDLVVLDECHRLKTRSAQRTLAIFGGERAEVEGGVRRRVRVPPIRARRRLLLTGTPIVNRPAELFPLLHYIDPDRWNSFFSFARRYTNATHNGYGWDFSGASNLDELQDRLRSTCLVRRLKSEVLQELPAKVRQMIAIEPSDADRRRLAAIAAGVEAREQAVTDAQAALVRAEAEGDEAAYAGAADRLQEALEVAFEQVARVRHEIGMIKAPYAREHLAGINGDSKVVVFAHHRDVIAALQEDLEPGTFAVITGDTPVEERQAAVERFQSDPRVTRFYGNIQAAGVGLTLTASSHVLFVEEDWVPGNMSQAEDRCHRIGQRDSVLVQHLVLDGSHDVRLVRALIEKQEVIDRGLDVQTDFDYATYVPRPAPPAAARRALPPVPPISDAQRAAVHQVLRTLAGICDGAVLKDDVGYNAADSTFGKELAARERLTDRQAHAAMRMVRKYRRQYGAELYAAMYQQEGGQ